MLQYGTVRNVNPSSSQTDSLSMEAIVQSKPPVKPNPAPYAPFLRCPDVEGKTERSRENLQPWHVGSSLIAIHQSCGSYGFWVSDEQSKKVAFQRLSPSIVSVQHQQASGVLKASWNVGKPFCKYLKHSKTNDAAFVSQANHTSKWEKTFRDFYAKCHSTLTTTTTTHQDFESHRWLVANCKYSFPAWRHANLDDSCQMPKSVQREHVCLNNHNEPCCDVWFRTVPTII